MTDKLYNGAKVNQNINVIALPQNVCKPCSNKITENTKR